MDEKPRKRPWFQFHLSTAVVLMFVAAGLLWLNMPETAAPEKVEAAINTARTSSESGVTVEKWNQGRFFGFSSTHPFIRCPAASASLPLPLWERVVL